MKREQYDALKKDFDAAKADYRIIEYPGAVHAFTNPEATELGKKFNLPLRYDAKADRNRRPKLPSSLPPTSRNKQRATHVVAFSICGWLRREIGRAAASLLARCGGRDRLRDPECLPEDGRNRRRRR